jgi:acyl-CoA synthetase (NDP forming)
MVTSARSAEIFERDHHKLASLSRDGHKPVLMWSYTLPSADSLRIMSETGFHLFTDMRHCARAAAELARYRAHRERFLRKPVAALFDAQRMSRVRAALNASTLCEYQISPLLREYDITPMDAELATSADDAVRIAAAWQAPVALKVQSRDIPHKTDAGAVALNVRDPGAIRDSYAHLLLNCKTYAPHARIDGVLVQRMAEKGIECIVGIRRDELFGPMIMVGLGGIYVEVLRDVVLAPIPLTRDNAQEMLSRLRGWALLDGVRGGKPADVSALIDLIVRLSQFAIENADVIDDLELNPVLVHDQGSGVSIVDSLLIARHSPNT